MSLLEALKSQQEQAAAFQGDVISTGGQIRLIHGKETITPVGGDQTFFHSPDKIGGLRFQLRDQGGMIVLSASMSMLGERVGIIDGDGNRIALPCYSEKPFATWLTWVHLLNTEFMNVNIDAADAIEKAMLHLVEQGMYKVYSRPPRPGQVQRERTAEILWDFEPIGNSLQDRHAHAISLDQIVLLPDERKAPLLTEYEKDGVMTERAGFTSFVDVLMHNTGRVLEAASLPPDHEGRADIARQANSRLSLLTGTDESTDEGYSLRPTLGHVTAMAPAMNEGESDDQYAERIGTLPDMLQGKEISLFPTKETVEVETTSEVAASYAGANPLDPFAGQTTQPDPTEG